MVGNEQRVLIVDDDANMRDALTELAESAGWRTQVYGSTGALLEDADLHRPGCVVLDVYTQYISRVDLYAHRNRRKCRLPIVYMSDHANIQMVADVFRNGAVDFLEKPVREQDFLASVTRALEKDALDRKTLEKREAITQRLATLTRRERDVLDRVVQGKTNKVIARELGISHRTVQAHRLSVRHKLRIARLAQLVKALVAVQPEARLEAS